MHFRILGPLEALDDDGVIVETGGDKRGALLALLLVNANQVVSIDHLIGSLWGDDPPTRAKGTVQAHVSRLRKALPANTLITRNPGYFLRLEPDDLDLSVFERMLGEAYTAAEAGAYGAASERLTAALSLWRGSALVDFAYEDWAQPTIGRFDDLRLAALEARLEADLELGRHQAVVTESEELVGQHPLRERLWAFLMLSLYRSGRQADALRAFSTARTTLAEELGIEPSTTLRDLEQRILMQDSSLDYISPDVPPTVLDRPPAAVSEPVAGVPGNLPSPLTSFVGRRAELSEVVRLLRGERLVTLSGPGGVGKTRLSLETARAVAAQLPGGAWFVDLSGVKEPARVPLEFAAALGLEARTVDEARAAVRARVRDHASVLVVDNCEEVVDEAADLIQMLVGQCPELTVLATSRCPLGIPGERVWVMPTLGLPGSDDPIDRVMASDAIDLFLERASLARPDWVPSEAELAVIAEICRSLDGIPLALELAAALLRTRSVESIRNGLDDRFSLLGGRQRGVPTRHQTLAGMLEDAVARLSVEARDLLALLGVFTGGFTREAVDACAGPSARSLDELVDAALVFVEYPGGGPRFGLLETVRAYARQALTASGAELDARSTHADYFASWAEMAAQMSVTDEGQWLDLMRLEHDNVRLALAWSLDARDFGPAVRLAAGYGWFWLVRGLLDEGRRWVEAVLEGADPDHPRYRDLLMAAGYLSGEQGDLAASTQFMEQTLAIDKKHGDPGSIAASLCNLSELAGMRGDLIRSRDDALRAIDLVEAIDRPNDLDARRGASIAINLADAYRRLGQYDEMVPLYERALELAVEVQALYERGRAEHGLGELALERRDYQEMEDRLTSGLAVAEEAGDLTLRSMLEELRAWSSYDRGDCDDALAAIRRGIDAAVAAGTYKESSAIFASASFLAEEAGLTAEADDYVARSIEASTSDWRRIHISEVRAWVAVRRGDHGLATRLVDEVDSTCRKSGYVRGRILQTIADRTRSELRSAAS